MTSRAMTFVGRAASAKLAAGAVLAVSLVVAAPGAQAATGPSISSVSSAGIAGQPATVSGQASPGATVALFTTDPTKTGYTQVATVTAAADGSYSVTAPLAYDTTAFVRTALGQSSTQSIPVKVKVTIDAVTYQYTDSRGRCVVRFNGGTYPYIPGAPVYIRTTGGTPVGSTRVVQYGGSGRYSSLFGLTCASTYSLFSLISGTTSTGTVYTQNGVGSPTTVTTPGVSTGIDDYPYRTDETNGADPWNFTMRQCVSFVAWRLHQRGHDIYNTWTTHWDSAGHWDVEAAAEHLTVSTRPVAGAVAQWHGGESSPYYSPGSNVADGSTTAGSVGHVAYVLKVYPDGSVLVEQYNGNGGDRSYSQMRVKAPRYLYIGVG